jgi:hypothetical protein
MNNKFLLTIFFAILPCCLFSQEEEGYYSALSYAKQAIRDVPYSKDDYEKALIKAVDNCEKSKAASKDTYEWSRAHYKAMLQALLIECEQIESLKKSDQEKCKDILRLIEKGRILTSNISKSGQIFLERTIIEYSTDPKNSNPK